MRMAGPDIVLFVVGAVLFGGATYAIVSLDGGLGSTSAAGFFDVTFATTDEELANEPVGDLRSATTDVAIDEAAARHLVALVFSVECSDLPAGAAAPFNIQLAVTGPNGQSDEASGACGSAVELSFPIADVPPDTIATGSTEEEARGGFEQSVHAGPPSPAIGTWSVTVSGGRGGPTGVIPVGNPSGAIVVTAQEWTPTFTPGTR